MKKTITLAFCLLALAGCHWEHAGVCHYDSHGTYHCHEDNHSSSHHDTVYYPEENSRGSNNIIIVEEYCDGSMPFYHDPEYCSYGVETCCTWMGSEYGWEETWCYDDCEWYMYSYQQEASYY